MTTTRKVPQDRKPSQDDVDQERQKAFEEVEGHELLVPFSKVKGSDQARLTQQLRHVIGDDLEDSDVSMSDMDFNDVADLIDYVSERFAVDSAKFDEFTCGKGGMERALNLTLAYVGEMGNDKN